MSVALVGLIGIQVYWINNAVKLRQQKFQSSVNEVLGDVVYQYEKLKTAESLAIKMDLREKRKRLIWQMDSINRAIRRTQDSLLLLQDQKLDGESFEEDKLVWQTNSFCTSRGKSAFMKSFWSIRQDTSLNVAGKSAMKHRTTALSESQFFLSRRTRWPITSIL